MYNNDTESTIFFLFFFYYLKKKKKVVFNKAWDGKTNLDKVMCYFQSIYKGYENGQCSDSTVLNSQRYNKL